MSVRGIRTWLDLETVEWFVDLAHARNVAPVARELDGFYGAYLDAGGDPDELREMLVRPGGKETWFDRRNNFVKRHMAQVSKRKERLWRGDEPSNRMIALGVWAFAPSPQKVADALGLDVEAITIRV